MSKCSEKAFLPSESIRGRWEDAHLLLIGFGGAAPASEGVVAAAVRSPKCVKIICSEKLCVAK